MQKCTRCGRIMVEGKDSWFDCPGCGLSRFVGVKAEPQTAENESEPLPSPTENEPKKAKVKAK